MVKTVCRAGVWGVAIAASVVLGCAAEPGRKAEDPQQRAAIKAAVSEYLSGPAPTEKAKDPVRSDRIAALSKQLYGGVHSRIIADCREILASDATLGETVGAWAVIVQSYQIRGLKGETRDTVIEAIPPILKKAKDTPTAPPEEKLYAALSTAQWLYTTLEMPEEAAGMLQYAMALAPEGEVQGQVRLSLAGAYERSKQYDKALAAYEQSAKELARLVKNRQQAEAGAQRVKVALAQQQKQP